MIDVSPKFNTLRYAKAKGELRTTAKTIEVVKNKAVPKGNLFEVARSAGISAAKRSSDWIVFCHPIPLDWVEIRFEINKNSIEVISEVKAIWKTGVEMEALTAVSAALINMYDMLKPLEQDLSIGNIRLLEKTGGKGDFADKFQRPVSAAVLVISDSTFAGKREDKSGIAIKEFLKNHPVEVKVYEVLPDNSYKIKERLTQLVDKEKVDLIFTTGGTGLGPSDITPEATKGVIEKEIPGIAETMRVYGQSRTRYAMLARQICGLRKQSIIINLPGSSRGAEESMQAIFPGILHAFLMIWGGGH
jgi:molybdenum cofactor biosynthesis protein MoaC